MCTASWCFGADGFELFFNRDEQRERARAEQPSIRDRGGVRFLAPIDGEAGGTWISANEWGLVLALLNAPCASFPPAERVRSRGSLVHDLACSRHAREAEGTLRALDLGNFRGFRMGIFEAGRDPVLAAWDGRRLTVGPAVSPLASSSLPRAHGSSEVEPERRRVFLERVSAGDGRAGDVEFLEAFHRAHVPRRGPLSVCMHREEARTVSSTHVSVTGVSVRMRYADGPPCRVPFAASLGLARRSPSAGGPE